MNREHWPPGLPYHLELPQTGLDENLTISALRYPQRVALHYYGGQVTYGELRRQVDALTGWLQTDAGVASGDRVALYLQNSPQFVIAYHAVLRIGAVVVPVNPMNRLDEVRHIVEDSGCRVAVFGQELAEHLLPLLGGALVHALAVCYRDCIDPDTDLPLPDIVAAPAQAFESAHAWHDALSAGRVPNGPPPGPDQLAVMPYTSGTTGAPKGCLHSHRSVLHGAVAGPEWCQASKDAVVFAALPMFHVTGLQNGINTPIYRGNAIVVLSRWDKRCAAMLIERHRISSWTAIPTMLIDFLNQDLSSHDLASLNLLTGGGAAMPAAFAARIRSLWGLDYVEGYGLSETMATTHLNPCHRPKPQCLGLPVFDTEARIVDPDSLETLPTGEVGEILLHGPQVFQGYHNRPQANAEAFVELDGRRWLRTGDLGRVDEDGYFFLVDRLKRMINASGYKVWPAEVEALLYGHPGVLEACVIASHDAHRGETVKALVVPRPDAELAPQSVIDWAREHMAAYKVPHQVELVRALPKGATGKVLWRALQEQERAALDGAGR